MRRAIQPIAVLLYCALAMGAFAQAGKQQFASLGNFKLDNGQVIEHCRIGYRTVGRLNAARSNAILFPTWFNGVSQQLLGNAGPGGMADPRRWFIVFIDALGDGVSSSPSNSKPQPRMKFPHFSLRDMVRAEHRLATRALHLRHVHAVMGISMGGMQTFQWAVSYPSYMDEAIPIVGSPRLTAYDLLEWTTGIEMIRENRHWDGGNYAHPPRLFDLWNMTTLHLTSPGHIARTTPRPRFAQFLRASEQPHPAFDPNDWIRQAQAMLRQNVARPYGGRLAEAAARVKAKMLIVPSEQDHMVDPIPAERFAKLIHARVFLMTSGCGHTANGCEAAKLNPVVREFLEKP